MKTNKLFYYLTIALFCGATLLTSCAKDEEDDTETTSSEDNSLAEKIYSDVADLADEAGNTGTVSSKGAEADGILAGSCATVTFDTANATKKITINFGSTNCLCNDLVYRRGEVIITHTGKYRDSLAVKNITFNNYYVNDNKVEGTKTITNNGRNNANHLSYTVAVNGSIILANNGGTITWTSNRTREWIAGDTTKQISDDKYSITGSASGTGVAGKAYTATITSPLIKDLSCHMRSFQQGVIELKPDGKLTRTIDYGTGACDRLAVVTIGKKTYNITVR